MIRFEVSGEILILDEMDLDIEKIIKVDLPTSFGDKELIGKDIFITCNPKIKKVYIGKKSYSFYDYMDMLRRLKYKMKGGR